MVNWIHCFGIPFLIGFPYQTGVDYRGWIVGGRQGGMVKTLGYRIYNEKIIG